MDKLLARLASERVKAKGGLAVTLTPWLEGDTSWGGYFPEFRKAGGELRREIGDRAGGDLR